MAQRWLDQEPFMSLIEDCWYAKDSAERVAARQAVKAFIRATLAGRPRAGQTPQPLPRPRRPNRQAPQPAQTRDWLADAPYPPPPPNHVYESSPEVSGYAATLLGQQPLDASDAYLATYHWGLGERIIEEQPPHVRLPEPYPTRDELLQWAGWEPAARPVAPHDPPVLHSAHNGDPDTTNHD